MTILTDLTIYKISEIMDETTQKQGFKLIRKSLEKGLPYTSYCPHAHKNAEEAKQCDFFRTSEDCLEQVAEDEFA